MEEKEKTYIVYCTEYGEKFHLDLKCRFIEGKQLKKFKYPIQVPNSQYVGPCNHCSKNILQKHTNNKNWQTNYKLENYSKKEDISKIKSKIKITSFDGDIEAFKESQSYLEMGESSLNKCNKNEESKIEIIENEKIEFSKNNNWLFNESSELDFNNNKFSTKNKREQENENLDKLSNDNIIIKQSINDDIYNSFNNSVSCENGIKYNKLTNDNILDETSKIEEMNKNKILTAIEKDIKIKNYNKRDNINKQQKQNEEHFTIINNEENRSKIDFNSFNNKDISENGNENSEKDYPYNDYLKNCIYNNSIGFSGSEIFLLELTNKTSKILNYNECWESNANNNVKDNSFDAYDKMIFGNYKFQFEIIPLKNKINLKVSVGFSIDYYSHDILFDNEKPINQSYETASYLKTFNITNKTGLINVIINISRGKFFVIGEKELKLREKRVFLTKKNTNVLYRRNFLAISIGDFKRVRPIFNCGNESKNVEIKINNKTINI